MEDFYSRRSQASDDGQDVAQLLRNSFDVQHICGIIRTNVVDGCRFPIPKEPMKDYRKDATAFVVCCLCVVFIAIPAYRYIDPNAAGLASQVLTPLLLALGAGFTFFRKQLKSAIARLSRRLRPRADA